MKLVGKLSLVLIALFAVSCDRLDKNSPLGADIINKLDSSAVTYDGEFNTQIIKPAPGAWNEIVDGLSGLHRYHDHLGRSGKIQSEMIIGEFNGEESFGYAAFMSQTNIDTSENQTTGEITYKTNIIEETIGWKIDSLLRKGDPAERKDSVTTAMRFYLNNAKHTEDFYPIEISTLPYSNDSIRIDTSMRHVMQSIVIPGDTNKFTFDLPYHFYQKEEFDTAWTTHLNGIEELTLEKVITKRVLEWTTGADSYHIVTSEGSVDTIVVDTTSTFTSSSIVNPHFFSPADPTLDALINESSEWEVILPNNGSQYKSIFVRERSDSIKSGDDWIVTVYSDTTIHSGTIDSLPDSTLFKDTLTYPTMYSYTSSDTSVDITTDEEELKFTDSSYTIFDTVITVVKNRVIQTGATALDTIDYLKTRSTYDIKDSIQAIDTTMANDTDAIILDTLNLLFKNTSDALNPMLHLTGNPVILLIGHKGESSDTTAILPYQSKMSVFETGDAMPSVGSTISGGLEQFVRLKVDIAAFWNLMYSRNYLNIVEANVVIPVLNSEIPAYRDSSFTLRTMVTDKSKLNGDLLNDSTARSHH